MRVLILADDCHPSLPSLPIVAYKAVCAIADRAEVTLVTHVRNRGPIEEAGGCGKAAVGYVDNDYIRGPLRRVSRVLRGGQDVGWTIFTAMGYFPYLAFEWEVWKRFRTALKNGEFDVVHRITPMSPTLPSPLAKWSPVPFVIGPLNGGLRWPRGFLNELRREREWLAPLRDIHYWLPYGRATYRQSRAVLAAFPHTIERLPRTSLGRVIDFPEVGVDPGLFGVNGQKERSGSVTFVFVGRLVPYKCADVAVRAFAGSPLLRRHRLLLVGDGIERARIERLIAENQLEACVEITGWKRQDEVAEYLRAADVFVFPSVRELGAGVVVEAMACGLAPVVVDYGAPGSLVGDAGIRIPLTSKNQMVLAFSEALESLAADPDRCRALGRAARERARSLFTWDIKADRMVEVYRWVTGQREAMPSFYGNGASCVSLHEARVVDAGGLSH